MQILPPMHALIKDHNPALSDRISTGCREPRGALPRVESDTNLISGESLIRQILYNVRIFHEQFGLDPISLWLSDAAGYSGALPQVLRGCGIPCLLLQQNSQRRYYRFPDSTFWWEGIDGSRVLNHVRRADSDSSGAVPPEFSRDLRTWVGELCVATPLRACTAKARNAQANRRSEFLLRDAEFLAAMHPDNTADYPKEELEEAWKLVLLNQCQAVNSESSSSQTNGDSAMQYERVREIGDGVVTNSLQAFARLLDTGDLNRPIAVWNTLSFQRSGLVSIPWNGKSDVNAFTPRGQASRTQVIREEGERRLLVEVLDVPAMGYMVYDLREKAKVKDSALAVTDVVRTDGRVLENDLVRVELNEYGGVVSFYDKQLEREITVPGAVGNLFQRFNNDADNREQDGKELTAPGTLEVVENGPLRASVRVERQLSSQSDLVQLIRLEANSRRLDFETFIDWHETHALLTVAFTVNVHSPRATYEIQFGHLDRPTHRNTSPEAARFEAPGHKWADLSESDYGVALLNDGKYGYDVRENVMRLSLLQASHDSQDRGLHHFSYSLLPHRGEAESSGVPLAGYDFNVPFRVQVLPVQHGMLARQHSYLRVDKPNLVIETVKQAEDGDGIIVRLFDAYRRRGAARLLVNGLASRATRTDLLERDLADLPVHGGAVTFDYRPFEIITIRLR